MESSSLTLMPLSKPFQTLNIVISTGRAKEFLGKNISLRELESMTPDEIDAYYKIYELNYADKVSDNISGSIIDLYSRAINKIFPIDDTEKLSEELNSDYIITTELKNITAGLAAVCGKLLSVFNLGIITFKHIRVRASLQDIEVCKEQDKELCNEHGKELGKEP